MSGKDIQFIIFLLLYMPAIYPNQDPVDYILLSILLVLYQ